MTTNSTSDAPERLYVHPEHDGFYQLVTATPFDGAIEYQRVHQQSDQCPWCKAHPHREACSPACAKARAYQQSDGELRDSISFTALIQALERLRSKHKTPNQWYEGWNAAIDCLLHDAKARAHAPVPEGMTVDDLIRAYLSAIEELEKLRQAPAALLDKKED